MYIKTNGVGLGKVPVEVNWFRKGFCLGCTSYKIANGASDNSGNFSFNKTIDSSFFDDYYLSVRIPTDTNYLSVPNGGGIGFDAISFYRFAPTELQNLRFEFYPKTYLTIRLHRTLSDNFSYFLVGYSFKDGFGYGSYSIAGSQFATDTTIRFKTSADIYTKITWKKNWQRYTSLH